MPGKQYLTLIFTYASKSTSFLKRVEDLRMDEWTVWELNSGQVIAQRPIDASTEKEHYIGAGKQFANYAFASGRRLVIRIEPLPGQVSMSMNLKLAKTPSEIMIRNLVVFNLRGPFHAASLEAQPPVEAPLLLEQSGLPAFTIDLGRVATRFWKDGAYSYKAKRSKMSLEQFRQLPAQ